MHIQNSVPYGEAISTTDEKKMPYTEDAKAHSDIESGEVIPIYEYDNDGPIEFEEKKDLKRGLKQRHIQMIALAGTIGTVRTIIDPTIASQLMPHYRVFS